MFENIFSASPQVWTGLISAAVAIPILIHLINLMRHQKVEWAAMEFLLRSHRKNRSWVWLKQWLLLISRIGALLLALFMLAQIGCENDRVARLLGGRSTHHYVLLDDSFSMGQQDGQGRAFDRGVGLISSIAARAKNRQNQIFSLLTFSNLQPGKSSTVLDALPVDTDFQQTIESIKAQLKLTASSASVESTLRRVVASIEQRTGENAIIYIVSDFCERQWKQVEPVKQDILAIERQGAAVELIDCSQSIPDNLAITRLAAVGNVRAAQTPLMMQVSIKNWSDQIAKKVRVDLESNEYPAASPTNRPGDLTPDPKALPAVFIDSIEPGETVSQAFPVFFNTAGHHTIVANLENDALAADNTRVSEVQIKPAARVLLIEQESQLASRFFSILLNPGGTTGIETELATESFLRDRPAEEFEQFDSIFLFDVGRLGSQQIDNLESYVRAGGGVVFFLGPNTDFSFYTDRLYRQGTGVFPIPVSGAIDIPGENTTDFPDLQPADHPVFAPANSVKNTLLNLVQVNRVVVPPIEWAPDSQSPVEVLATVRGADDRPLVISKRLGAGRSVAVTTTADARWNNWMRNATFLPIMLLLQDHVAVGRFSYQDRLVGETIEFRINGKSFRNEATMVIDGASDASPIPLTLIADAPEQKIGIDVATDQPGIYEFWAQRNDGSIEITRPVVNVDTSESDLTPAKHDALTARLGGTQVNLVDWNEFNPEPKIKPASLLNRLLFCLLVLVLMSEQLLSYATNYHR